MGSGQQDDLIRKHYTTDNYLRIRQEIHDQYSVPARSFADWVIARVPWQGGERLLDVGCGNGLYYKKLIKQADEIDYYGIDLIESMIRNHPLKGHSQRIALGNAEDLPYPNNSFDIVMANHMMHHVSDVEKALDEFRRILAPGGIVIIATNSMNTMPELQVLLRRAIVLLTRTGAASVRAPELPTDRFALENGIRILAQHYFAVVRHDLPSALVFPDVDPAMLYLESSRDLREATLPDDVAWEDVMMIMRQQINQLIRHLGELVINKQTGVLIASNDGRFIHERLAQHKADLV